VKHPAERGSIVIRKSRNNCVQGFLMSQLCLQLITQRGLRFILDVDSNAPNGPLQKEPSLGTPDWSKLIDSQPQHSRRLYLPQESNVDGAVMHLESRPPKKVHHPCDEHKKSDEEFYTHQWKGWVVQAGGISSRHSCVPCCALCLYVPVYSFHDVYFH